MLNKWKFVIDDNSQEFEFRNHLNFDALDNKFLWKQDSLIGDKHHVGLSPIYVKAVEFAPGKKRLNVLLEGCNQGVQFRSWFIDSGVVSEELTGKAVQ